MSALLQYRRMCWHALDGKPPIIGNDMAALITPNTPHAIEVLEDAEGVVLSENPIRPGLARWRRIISSFWAMFAILHALEGSGQHWADAGDRIEPAKSSGCVNVVFHGSSGLPI